MTGPTSGTGSSPTCRDKWLSGIDRRCDGVGVTALATTTTTARYARWEGVGRGFTTSTADVPTTPGAGEVLVRIDLATICGSDLHSVAGDRPSPAPGVLGHEQVGTVVAVGAGVAPCVDGTPVEVGRRVVWSVAASCGSCARCRRGLPQKCTTLVKYGHEPLDPAAPLTGGFATHCVLRRGTAIVRVPDALPDEVASPAACAAATVAAVLAAAPDLGPGRRVLVTGAGMLGVTATAMAADMGAEVVVVDPHPERRERARAFGASEATGDVGTVEPVDLACELSGAPAAVAACVDALDVGGTAVLAGSVFPGPAVALDPQRLVRGLHTVTGVHNYAPADLQRAVDFLTRTHGRFPFADLVAGAHDLDDLTAAFDAAASGATPRRGVRP